MSFVDILITIAVVLGLLAAISMFSSIGKQFNADAPPGKEPTVNEPVKDNTDGEEAEPMEYVRGGGKYSKAHGVYTYDYEADVTDYGFDVFLTTASGDGNINTMGVLDVDGNACWQIKKDLPNNLLTDNIMTFTPTNAQGNEYVFETDMKWLGCDGSFRAGRQAGDTYVFCLQFIIGSTNVLVYGHMDDDKNLVLSSNQLNNYNAYAVIPLGEWINLRVVISESVSIYVNNDLVSTVVTAEFVPGASGIFTPGGKFNSLKIYPRCYEWEIEYYLDNTYVSSV